MYYRRKILLALLQSFDNRLEKLRLQKLLFLLTRLQKETAVYDFVPYKFGCYSFQANADLNTLKKYGIIDEEKNAWVKTNEANYITDLKRNDGRALKTLYSVYGKMSKNSLIAYTYEKYPFYAINSAIANELVSENVLYAIKKQKSSDNNVALFTIGYEGRSLEFYLNLLLKNNVKALCDVRNNANSMKYGFSKKQLQNACDGIGIKYFHFSEVGIISEKRKDLNTQADYDRLFNQYKIENLANINQCHRKHLAESIATLPEFDYEIIHI